MSMCCPHPPNSQNKYQGNHLHNGNYGFPKKKKKQFRYFRHNYVSFVYFKNSIRFTSIILTNDRQLIRSRRLFFASRFRAHTSLRHPFFL